MHTKWLYGFLLLGTALADSDRTPKKNGDPLITNQAPPRGEKLSRRRWSVTCDSSDSGHACEQAIDGKLDTFWLANGPATAHEIIVDLGRTEHVNALSAVPRQDGKAEGQIAEHQVFVSETNGDWGEPVAFGTWYEGAEEKLAIFEPKDARYVRLVAVNQDVASIAELNVYEANEIPQVSNGGVWGPTVDFPLVPVSGAVLPTGEVLVWSSWAKDDYLNSRGYTLTAIWDLATNKVTRRKVQETHHDMFCSGSSYDGTGNLLVTGGNNDKSSSIYNPDEDTWEEGPLMALARGYQASATIADGRVFIIGGSWNGGTQTNKTGEIYDPETNSFSVLPGARVQPMWTDDAGGGYRRDNHGWLFGWKDNTVFQAGPSKNMNWYYTDGQGDVQPAGRRGNADDAMSGNAVMFDTTAGKIITFGGSPDYVESVATADAHLVEIAEPGSPARVVPAKNAKGENGMNYPRAFHTSVVLPDGTVFVAGGQSFTAPFSDNDAQTVPELYDPATNTFKEQQPNNIFRTYHSISLLLPDARVFNGGGGLGVRQPTNHFDAQIYTPQYLLNADGSPAARPRITHVVESKLRPGGQLRIRADIPVRRAALVRYGTTTHTVNTDQRRIALDSWQATGSRYSTTLPDDPGALLPGWWMLFILNDKGVPSVAETIQIMAQ